MARPKTFDEGEALDAAIAVFREHGFEGTSAGMLVDGMKIGRQSLYDTFGDKWRLYLAALQRYAGAETAAHIAALNSQAKAIDGIRSVVERVIGAARQGCLGVNSVCEFGDRRPEINAINAAAGRTLRAALAERVREAQQAGDVSRELDPDAVVDFLSASFAGIRIAARGGAGPAKLSALGEMALRALR